MKYLLVLVAALGAAQAAVTCDECQAAAQDFVSHLLTEESLAEQVQLMKDNVCPQVTQNHTVSSQIYSLGGQLLPFQNY